VRLSKEEIDRAKVHKGKLMGRLAEEVESLRSKLDELAAMVKEEKKRTDKAESERLTLAVKIRECWDHVIELFNGREVAGICFERFDREKARADELAVIITEALKRLSVPLGCASRERVMANTIISTCEILQKVSLKKREGA